MVSRKRLTRAERRRSIVRAAAPIFASKGFRGATTRDLAQAAGVSEALLYRHFPSKQALYEAITREHLEDRELHPGFDRLLAMAPSTRRLVLTVEYLIGHVVEGEGEDFPRLMAQSLLGDGEFARTALARFQRELGPFFVEALAAARAAGDLESEASEDAAALWWVQHLGLALRLVSLPPERLIRYGGGRRRVVQGAVRFALRGLGLTAAAMAREYQPGAWRRL